MKSIDTRSVLVYHVELSDEETNILIDLGWFPRESPRPARLWLQDTQIDEWRRILDEKLRYPH